MTTPEIAAKAITQSTAPGPTWRESLAVYLQRRVLIVMFLGFSSGLPLALSGSTLLVWMRESGVDLGTIGLFALVGTPYTLKFLWAPLVDALHVPFFTRQFGRRRGWLLFSQLLLIAATLLLALADPARSPAFVALAALLVATTSSTQDIVVDAFRVESLPESEQAAGMAGYVAAYRIGMLASTAGALFLVSGYESTGTTRSSAWTTSHPSSARTAERLRPRARDGCRAWSREPTCAATCTPTPTGATASTRSSRWPRPPAVAATPTRSCPTTRRASASRTDWIPSASSSSGRPSRR